MGSESQELQRPTLSVVSGDRNDEDDLYLFVRSVRRDMARLLRALQASGRSPSMLPDPLTTRLAHVDSVTARYLIDRSTPDEEEVRGAANSMRAVERWIVERLSAADLAEVRAHEISVRVDENELHQPVIRTDWLSEELGEIEGEGELLTLDTRSVRFGLASLADEELGQVCLRLGIRVDNRTEWGTTPNPATFDPCRLAAEQAILKTLLDGHLLAILIATLPGEAHRLLAALIRGKLDEGMRERLAERNWNEHLRIGLEPETPAQMLRGCALAFIREGQLWVPMEIHRRADGVLRAFGV